MAVADYTVVLSHFDHVVLDEYTQITRTTVRVKLQSDAHVDRLYQEKTKLHKNRPMYRNDSESTNRIVEKVVTIKQQCST